MEVTGSKNGRSVSRGSKNAAGGKGRNESPLLADTKALIKVLKDNKIEYYKCETLEMKFSRDAFLPDSVPTPKSETQQEDIDELLYYSAAPRS